MMSPKALAEADVALRLRLITLLASISQTSFTAPASNVEASM